MIVVGADVDFNVVLDVDVDVNNVVVVSVDIAVDDGTVDSVVVVVVLSDFFGARKTNFNSRERE